MSVIAILKIVGAAAYMGLEAWLGKTDKVKAGSVLEVIWNAVSGLIK